MAGAALQLVPLAETMELSPAQSAMAGAGYSTAYSLVGSRSLGQPPLPVEAKWSSHKLQ